MITDPVITFYLVIYDQVVLNQNPVKNYLSLINELKIKSPKFYMGLLSYHEKSLRESLQFDVFMLDPSETWGLDLITNRHNEILKRVKECKHMFYPTLESIVLDKIKEAGGDLSLLRQN